MDTLSICLYGAFTAYWIAMAVLSALAAHRIVVKGGKHKRCCWFDEDDETLGCYFESG